MSRFVIDTSTLVGAVLHAASIPHRAWLKAQSTGQILGCSETISELETVLHRTRLERYIDPVARDEFLLMFRATVEQIKVELSELIRLNPKCRDSKDNIFLAVAQIGDAQSIISSDHDLLVLHPWNGIPILTPAKFLAETESDHIPETP